VINGKKTLARLKTFANRPWYAPMVGFFAGADQFIIVVPIEWLIIPGVLVRPKRWLGTALWVSTGCALGALALASVTDIYGQPFIEHAMPSLSHSPHWNQYLGYLQHGSAWALALIALSPLPQQPAVALAGLTHMPLLHVFVAVWFGRSLKYGFVAWASSHAPRLLGKIPGAKKLEQEIKDCEK
jgi:membrane protein YqaA with SNARE-associated domain